MQVPSVRPVICKFCQTEIPQGQESFLDDGQGKVFVCQECSADVIEFFKSGQSEKRKMGEDFGKLDFVTGRRSPYSLDFCEVEGMKPVKFFDNLLIKQFKINRPFVGALHNRNYHSYPTPLIVEDRRFNNPVEVDAIFIMDKILP